MSTDDLIFEDPPIAKGGPAGSGRVGLWLASLRSHPGVWAKYPEPVSVSMPTLIHQGKRAGVVVGEFEATGRYGPDLARGKTWLYARYVGVESAAVDA